MLHMSCVMAIILVSAAEQAHTTDAGAQPARNIALRDGRTRGSSNVRTHSAPHLDAQGTARGRVRSPGLDSVTVQQGRLSCPRRLALPQRSRDLRSSRLLPHLCPISHNMNQAAAPGLCGPQQFLL